MRAAASAAAVAALSSQLASAQQPGTTQPESHPQLWTQECSASGCSWEQGAVVLDANWRWALDEASGENCYLNDNTWDPARCSDAAACAATCSIQGADYESTYGIKTDAYKTGLNLDFVTEAAYGNNYGSRVYLLDAEDKYKMFHLKNREFTMDVDVSNLPCGLNGAVYFVEMSETGDEGPTNRAGAKYGTGYCDAQCPHDMKWIKGEANSKNWNASSNPPIGHYGACCAEMDIWEANSRSTAYTPHPCAEPGLTKCEGAACGDNTAGERYDGTCDKDGCDYNSYRMGEFEYYGRGSDFTVDSTKKMTIVTQFITEDGTDDGDLVDIRRFYVQDGTVIENSEASLLGPGGGRSVTDGFCAAQKSTFGDIDDFTRKGGLKTMGEALGRGMVLVLSLWDDSQVNMLWLDSVYPPTNGPPTQAGLLRGPCPGGAASTPEVLRATVPESHVAFSNIRVGTLGSTTTQAAGGGGRRLGEESPAGAVHV